MNEQLLRTRLDGAVADIRPTSRLDEILARPAGGRAEPPPPPKPDRRRATWLAAAAIVVLLAALAAVLVVRTGDDRTTRLQPQPVATTLPSGTRIGSRLSVLASSLPPGMRVIDESPEVDGADAARFSRYAQEPGLWTGEGPYLRVSALHGLEYADYWATTERGELVGQVQGHDAYRVTGAPGQPTSGEGTNPWKTLTWATGPDEVIEIQSKGLDDATVLAIAQTVAVEP